MVRVLSLFLPYWPTDRLRRKLGDSGPSVDVPLVLKGSDGRRRVITAADDLAQQIGARIGMPVAKAESLYADLVIMDSDPTADTVALEKLAIWGLRLYSPIVAADPPDGIVLDVQGAAHLYGGEEGLVADAVRRLAELGITARAALADTWGCAHALARFGGKPQCIIPPGGTSDALVRLPIEALRLPQDMLPDLRLLGLDTIGELAAKPRPPLTQSFGPKLFRRIDQAFARLAEPINPVESPELISVIRNYDEPISAAETIERRIIEMIDAMCDRLEVAGLGVRRLDLHFTRVDNRIETIFVSMAKPVRGPGRLAKLMCAKIEQVDPGWGVDKMVLTAACVETLTPQQVVASFSEPPRPDVDELWDVIGNRYGHDSLYRAISVATDIPERCVKRLPPSSTEMGSLRNAAYRRPHRIYRRPEPIQTLAALPDHPPRAFTWRNQRYTVAFADGPERVRGEWWVSDNEKGKVRDYFILEVDNGERFWVFRAGDGQHAGTGSLNWYLQGKFG